MRTTTLVLVLTLAIAVPGSTSANAANGGPTPSREEARSLALAYLTAHRNGGREDEFARSLDAGKQKALRWALALSHVERVVTDSAAPQNAKAKHSALASRSGAYACLQRTARMNFYNNGGFNTASFFQYMSFCDTGWIVQNNQFTAQITSASGNAWGEAYWPGWGFTGIDPFFQTGGPGSKTWYFWTRGHLCQYWLGWCGTNLSPTIGRTANAGTHHIDNNVWSW